MRRGSWLVAGMAVGAGGTLWARRRIEELSKRMRSKEAAADLARLAGRGARAGASRFHGALSDGRRSARVEEERLWQELELRARRN